MSVPKWWRMTTKLLPKNATADQAAWRADGKGRRTRSVDPAEAGGWGMSSDTRRALRDFISLQRGTTYKGALVGLPGPVLLGLASIEPNGGFRYGGFKTYGGDCPEKISLKSGDLYVSLKDVTQSGDLLGSIARVPSDIASGRLTQDTVKLVFDGDPVSRDYIYWLLRTPAYREYCRGCATGTTTLGLSRDDFLDFPVPSPAPADELLIELLEGVEKRITLLRETTPPWKSLPRRCSNPGSSISTLCVPRPEAAIRKVWMPQPPPCSPTASKSPNWAWCQRGGKLSVPSNG